MSTTNPQWIGTEHLQHGLANKVFPGHFLGAIGEIPSIAVRMREASLVPRRARIEVGETAVNRGFTTSAGTWVREDIERLGIP